MAAARAKIGKREQLRLAVETTKVLLGTCTDAHEKTKHLVQSPRIPVLDGHGCMRRLIQAWRLRAKQPDLDASSCGNTDSCPSTEVRLCQTLLSISKNSPGV